MQRIGCIWVGKLKERHWRDGAEFYRKRLDRWFRIDEQVVKDAPGKAEPTERIRLEGERIVSALDGLGTQVVPVCLDERGKAETSRKLATFLQRMAREGTVPCFIIGGAYGLSDTVKERCSRSLGLGPMTFTHEMARVILLEQLYRAESINRGLPYHHD